MPVIETALALMVAGLLLLLLLLPLILLLSMLPLLVMLPTVRTGGLSSCRPNFSIARERLTWAVIRRCVFSELVLSLTRALAMTPWLTRALLLARTPMLMEMLSDVAQTNVFTRAFAVMLLMLGNRLLPPPPPPPTVANDWKPVAALA